ncbi:MAG: NPCBM/NEW2 domain-containing protein [Planctomycetales bacterium]|nr:NPCBM/NEW2 domain-containing protein [Planctomycetales bacterium]
MKRCINQRECVSCGLSVNGTLRSGPLAALVCALSLSLLGNVVRAERATAILADGKTLSGELVSVDAKAGATFQTDGGTRDVPLDRLVEWGVPREATGPIIVLLTDGSELSALQVSLAGDDLVIASPVVGRVRVAVEHVSAILFDPPTLTTERDALIASIRARSEQNDRVATRGGDAFSGILVGISAEAVTIERADASFDVPLADVGTIALDPTLGAVPDHAAAGLWCGLADGSRVLARGMSTADGNVRISHAGTSTLSVPLDAVVWLQPVRVTGGVTYLSDLEPAEYRNVPLVGSEWPYRLDAAVTGAPLRAAGRRYAKGVGLHSASRLTYDLAGKYSRFASLVAIDDHVPAGQGSVVFRVRTDGNVVYESLPIRSGDEPQAVDVDVSGASRLTLEVDYADRGHVLDRADWLGARLMR